METEGSFSEKRGITMVHTQAKIIRCRHFSMPARQTLMALMLLVPGCTRDPASGPPVVHGRNIDPIYETVETKTETPDHCPLCDAAESTGLVFQHENGMFGQRYILEIMGPGSAMLDYDRDGDLDIFLVQGRSLAPAATSTAALSPGHRLFRNDVTTNAEGKPLLKFTDVTDAAGLTFSDYGMGAIAGDYNNDGNTDLYVTCYGHDRLLQNTGQQTFEDVTESAGLLADPAWSTSASWVDIDRDGQLDLFVCQYLEWTPETHVPCKSPWGGQGYCGPKSLPPSRSRLYRNAGDGKFVNVSQTSQISSKAGAALGVVGADINGDGWADLFVANDAMPNYLWINQHDGTFYEEALIRGCAVNGEGGSEGNMGIVAADFFYHGGIDLFITHLKSEHATFYQNLGEGYFADMTASLGLDATTRPYTGFGTGALDFDNDGARDIFIANGGVQIDPDQERAGIAVPLRQRSLLFRNHGKHQPEFAPITGCACLDAEETGRGAAFGDLDNDGDTDILVNNNHGPARLLLNDVGQLNHWLGVRLTDGPEGAEYIVSGAIAELDRTDEPKLTCRSATDGSYLSSSDPRLIFGLGDSTETGVVRIRWPDGLEEIWENLNCDQYHELRKGTGTEADPLPASVSEKNQVNAIPHSE